MKRATLASVIFLLFCVSNSAVCDDPVHARIMLGAREVVVTPSPIRFGDSVLAPVQILESMGASYTVGDAGVKVTSANGSTGELKTVNTYGAQMLRMDALLQITGGHSEWDEATSTLKLTAALKSVEFADGALKINCSFPVSYAVGSWGGKIWVDVNGAKLETETNEVYIGEGGIVRARLGQTSDTTARVTMDLEKSIGYQVVGKSPSSQVVVRVGNDLAKPARQAHPGRPEQSLPFKINSIRLVTLDNNSFNLVIGTTGRGSINADYGVAPPRMTLEMRGASLAESVSDIDDTHPLLKKCKLSRPGSGGKGVQIHLEFARIVSYTAKVDENAITVNITLPEKAGGHLADKVVVIDPGHGGAQPGAQCVGLCEKEVTLQIANAVAAALQAEGARVILTRTGDTEMALAARSEVAKEAKADFFLSFHCNSNSVPGSAEGIETYYHMQDSGPKALAYTLHASVCAVTGMCDRRARSDRSLYSSGLGVLRNLEGSGIPGILIECGYLNSATDRARLVSPAYQKKLAAGVAAGLKAYVEGTPILDRGE